ncbi:hypothetical protein FOXYSP1_04220 [Fusarium oxysporum f. sp. phaseoli]
MLQACLHPHSNYRSLNQVALSIGYVLFGLLHCLCLLISLLASPLLDPSPVRQFGWLLVPWLFKTGGTSKNWTSRSLSCKVSVAKYFIHPPLVFLSSHPSVRKSSVSLWLWFACPPPVFPRNLLLLQTRFSPHLLFSSSHPFPNLISLFYPHFSFPPHTTSQKTPNEFYIPQICDPLINLSNIEVSAI